MADRFAMPRIGYLGIFGLIGAAIFFAVMVTNLFSGAPGSGDGIAVGEEAYIRSGGKSTPLAATRDDYDAVQKALLARDWAGLRQLIIQEKALVVDEGTRVLVVDKSWDWTMTQVKVLEGAQAGRIGWVAEGYVAKRRGP